jgi:protein-tyrosine sulfotransferase
MNGEGPIFILSSARSGSTLARIILDTHPAIYSPPELNLGRLARDLYSSISWLEGTHDLPPAENRAAVERTRTILAELLDSYTRRRGKTIWCEKSPDNLRFRDLLAEVFPEARFLCLYRHPLDVVQSCLETFRHGFPPGLQSYVLESPGDTVQAFARYWVDTATWALELERRLPERTFRVRYEDLVAEPARTLAPLFHFLALEWDPALLASVFSAEHDRGPGDPYVYFTDRIRPDSVGAGRNLPTDGLTPELRERAGALLAELGYAEKPERLAAPGRPQRMPEAELPEAADGAGREGSVPDARWIFETLLPERAASGALPAAPLACEVTVHGKGGGAWDLEVDEIGLRVAPASGGMTAKIELEEADLLAIVNDQANPLKIAQEGRILVEGLGSEEALRGLLQLVWSDPAA